MVNDLPQREVEICQRLRQFRETTKIPRTQFALTLGIGGERLASYEAGRVPVRYEIFRLLAKHFSLNPIWLATGRMGPKQIRPFDDSGYFPQLKGRPLFSEVYDLYIADRFDPDIFDASSNLYTAVDHLHAALGNKLGLKKLSAAGSPVFELLREKVVELHKATAQLKPKRKRKSDE